MSGDALTLFESADPRPDGQCQQEIPARPLVDRWGTEHRVLPAHRCPTGSAWLLDGRYLCGSCSKMEGEHVGPYGAFPNDNPKDDPDV